MAKVTVVAVHPTVIIVQTENGSLELPSDWFPQAPKVGQEWNINLDHTVTDQEKLDQLNGYLTRD